MRVRAIRPLAAALALVAPAMLAAGCGGEEPVRVAEGEVQPGELPNGAGSGFIVDEDAIDDTTRNDAAELGSDQRCLGETRKAESIELDIFVMLDSSGSMLDAVPGTNAAGGLTTKWDAVRASLQTFVQAPETADIGVGLQYFPQVQEDVPFSCTDNDECGATGGPCSTTLCVNAASSGPFNFVRPSGDVATFCFDDRECAGPGQACRQMLGRCVVPAGVFDDAPDGQVFDLIDDADGEQVGPLCNGAGDCAGLPGTVCEAFGICQNSVAAIACSPSVRCQDGGPCLALPNGCVNQTRCEVGDYAQPAVPISTDVTRSFNIIQSLGNQIPNGLTPTGPALAGALEHARQWAVEHPGRQVVTVMATDGFPTECAPLDIADIADIARDANAGDSPVRTFVIGVFGALDLGLDGEARLDLLARAGGTERAIVIDTGDGNVSSEFLEALNLIRDTAVSCDFQLTADRQLDYDQVNLRVTRSDGDGTDLFNVGTASGCGPGEDGWYYVRDERGTPTRVSVCPSTCEQLSSGDIQAELQIGCETRIR